MIWYVNQNSMSALRWTTDANIAVSIPWVAMNANAELASNCTRTGNDAKVTTWIFYRQEPLMNTKINSTDACGGLIDSPNGTIISPSFPDLYPSNKHCIWEIFAPPQYRITLNFTHFDLEGNNVSWQILQIPKATAKFKTRCKRGILSTWKNYTRR